jgi:oxygen-independent coproporphyrinogen-3 oxidase
VTSLKHKGEMVAAMQAEMALRRDFFTGPLQTVYFGGGTPSTLTYSELMALLETADRLWGLPAGGEITLEGNPDDLTPDYLADLHQAGINRLSIGIQSFDEQALTWMNRSHDAARARACLRDAREAGFTNFSADLIFGVPGVDWSAQLQEMAEYQVPHLSVYALTVEEKTALAAHIRKGKTRVVSDEVYEEQFMEAHNTLTTSGYAHYEISNYALPGHEAVHNGNYWRGVPYLGIGPSAHSYSGTERSWNVANNARYLQALAEGRTALEETETLTPAMRWHESLMTGLRTAEGIVISENTDSAGGQSNEEMLALAGRWVRDGLATFTANRLILTPKGWLISDALTMELM